ncbi:hypothetical protein J8F10_26615 [Gemmata sp. G18]|uniref:Uncharacterized protein n=1 Tax=Gemmata palustris TaxID=2822762 RepID=A0ABS5C022_9BACT|nr:hypothetical protein [Gemmata palustris]MBP3958835.1 hypothetical protein [Gemmata palustris]
MKYLNDGADRLQSITDADVRVTARDHYIPLPPLSGGGLTASQPRNFRMVAGTLVGGAKVDLGSNDQHFWVYGKFPGNEMFVSASHIDFNEGRAKIPGDIPFEPEWVMQALGMAHFPPAGTPATDYKVKVDSSSKARTYTLSWNAVTPNKVPVTKEIVFDGDAATGNRPQVKKHAVYNMKNKLICSAEIKEAKTVPVGDGVVQYPTKVLLRWEEQKFEMELELSNAKINQPLSPADAQNYFSRPTKYGQPIDLARHEAKPLK